MKTSGLRGVRVGDELVLVRGRRLQGENRPVTVSRVGRAYVYVACEGRELRQRFRLETGVAVGQNGAPDRLLTPAQHDETALRWRLFVQLFAAGVKIEKSRGAAIPTEKLQALLGVMRDETADDSTATHLR